MDAANEVVANATPEEVEVLAGNGTPAQVSAARNHAAKRALRAVGKYLPDGALPAVGGYAAGLATAPALRRASDLWGYAKGYRNSLFPRRKDGSTQTPTEK